ncbi:hypothetical protein [Xanthocytophaga agilis]|uniref:Uncharacterized protein n=1 Tax=Xanthocytophaga agilis TaxID=3048010 RepID=A0AAE3RAA1_9BACT|nr:hypothetical protein [Xanthocytophaga agilis]MDJ1506831.1 hypothetical protein [Xanthocytophaga agilis]
MYFDAEAYEQYQQSHQSSTNFWRRATQTYENAYLHFLEWGLQHPDPQKSPIRLSITGKNRRYSSMVYEFFQSKGLVINILGQLQDKQIVYTFQILQDTNANYQITDPDDLACKRGYPTRYDAETAAFKLAFTALDNWIEEQQSFGFKLR